MSWGTKNSSGTKVQFTPGLSRWGHLLWQTLPEMSCGRRPPKGSTLSNIIMSFKNILVSFKHLYNIHMSLRISPIDVCGYQQNPITMIISHVINWCVVCDAAIECTIRELWDCMFSLHPTDLERRLRNREHLVPYLKTSPMDWLNYCVSGWWWKSPQLNWNSKL